MVASQQIDWWDVDAAAPRQVITRSELNTLGVTQRMIGRRIGHGGPWQRILPGVIMLRNGTPTPDQLVAAALKYAGEGAVVTGLAAARLHDMRKFAETEKVHLLLPHGRHRMSTGYVRTERTTRLPDVVRKRGFPIADVARAVLDATRAMKQRADVEALIAESVQRGLTTTQKLAQELRDGPVRGSALSRGALVMISEGARSTAEADAVRLAARSGLPRPRWNIRLSTPSGLILPTPDGWFDEVCLAWEIDSYEYHLSPADYANTLRRHTILTGHGIVVVHTLPSRLRTEPDAVIAELRAAYEKAALRPRPHIIAG